MNKNKKTKFIIFGQSRSGSTLLLELIISHPEILCEGELFNKIYRYVNPKWYLKLLRRVPLLYINHRMRKSDAPVYGFKLFFFQVNYPEKLLKQLYGRGWKFVFIRRKDILAQSLSNIIALETNYWHRRKNENGMKQALTIPPERLLKVLKNRTRWKEKEAKMMRDYEHFTVVYETDLKNKDQWQKTLDKVFEYLGVGSAPVKTNLEKTDPRPYSERIQNFDELIDTVKNSKFAHLLEDSEIEHLGKI
jgi:G:T-mismatch repair DNA endonuclease (very short patch repair protein)